MSGGWKRGAGRRSKEDAEVEELLRAAQDDLLLNLTVDAHTTSSSSSSLDPDLARRFNALKSPSPAAAAADPRQNPSSKSAESSRVPVGDLEARFAALKGSLGSSGGGGFQKSVSIPNKIGDDDDDDDDDDEGVSKKEVDKVMQWAMDAARLDPSKSDDESEDDETEDSEQQQEEEEEMKQVRNQRKGNKWLFF